MVAQQIIAAHDAARQREGGIVGLATGYRGLDRLKGGFRHRDLVYLAGRPGMGKTALAIGIAKGVAEQGERVYFASAEMDGASVQVRAVAAESGLPAEALERAWIIDPGTNQGRRLTQHEYDRFFEANRKVGALPIVWDVRAAPTVASIRARARREKARHGLAMVIVDHIGLLSPGAEFRDSNRNNELSRISAGLKAMQVELQVPVIALSQLSRKVEEREDKRPMLSDLRDSGSLEQDADAVAFVFREEYYLKKFPPKRRDNETEEKFIARSDSWRWRLTEVAGVGEVILAKHRQGPEGTVRLRWDARLTWFFDDDGSASPHADHGGPSPASHGASPERQNT
jgi:replicative DNA helicase